MDELWKALLPALIEYGIPIVSSVLSFLGAKALVALRQRFNSEAASSALDRLERVAALAVQDVERTIVRELREAAADGQITIEEAREVRASASLKIKSVMGTDGLKALRASEGDIRTIIDTVIEAKVGEMKVRQSMVPPEPSVDVDVPS